MSFIGIKSAGTISGSHEWQLDKLEHFTITLRKAYLYKKLAPNALRFTHQNLKSSTKKNETKKSPIHLAF